MSRTTKCWAATMILLSGACMLVRGALAGFSRVLILTLALLAFAMLLPPPVSAHGDRPLMNSEVTLAPGESIEVHGDLHYHRIVGQIAADGPVLVRMVDSRTGEIAIERGPAENIRFNELIRCCDDRGWAPFTLVVENAGDEEIGAIIRAKLAHDDLAVTVFGAESFTREPIVIMGVVWAMVLWRVSRKKPASLSPKWAAGVTGALVMATVSITAYGGLRYGPGIVPAFLAGSSDIPLVPTNSIVSGTSLVLVILGVTWALAGVWWAKSSGISTRNSWIALGALLAILASITGALIGATYGTVAVPLAAALLAATPILVVLAAELSNSPRSRFVR